MKLFAEARLDIGFPVLDQLPWSDDNGQEALRTVEILLRSTTLPKELAAWLAAQPEEKLEWIIDRSLERTTHFKWFLGGCPGKYTVWLHEYKSPEIFRRAVDFAASVHNHRYGFSSRVLSGALHVSEFAITDMDGPLRLAGVRTVQQGETMILTHEDIHRVDRVESHTCTLLVQGPIARSFSTCYDIFSGRPRRIYDLQSKLPRTIKLLTADYFNDMSIS